MFDKQQALLNVGEAIDALVTVDVSCRGVINSLYKAAREKQGRPLCLLAAEKLAQNVKKGDVIIIATGFPMSPWLIGEQDGPIGAATLARALIMGLIAKPVIVTEKVNVDMVAATVRGAGLHTFGLDKLMDYTTTVSVVDFPLDSEEAKEAGDRLLRELKPKALITIERPGANEKGEYHYASGKNLTPHVAKLDYMFEKAKQEGILTIGIGDGGNELGCGMIKDTVFDVVPFAKKCKCPCGGTSTVMMAAETLVMATVSNWGAYGIEAALSTILDSEFPLHEPEVEIQAHTACAQAGADDSGKGLVYPGADNIPLEIHADIVQILNLIVKSGFDPGRVYRIPRYPWL